MGRVAAWWSRAFGTGKPAIGVVHLPALPGAPRNRLSVDRIVDRAVEDARLYLTHGMSGLIVENFGDVPFVPGSVAPSVVAAMTRVASAVREVAGDRPVGVNVLRNDAQGALAVAAAAGLSFLRVNVLMGTYATDQGLLEGDAAALLRERRALGAEEVRIFADVRVKHAAPLREAPIEVEVEELVRRAGADAVLVTGVTTGRAPDVDRLASVSRAAGPAPVLVASGADLDNVAALAAHADGFVVGTSLEVGGRTGARPDPERIKRFARALAKAGRVR